MGLAEWNTALQFGSAVVLGLAFVIGAGAVWTSYVLGKRQDERIAVTERATAEANERAGKLELEVSAQRERAAKLELDAAQQRERAAKAETELLAIKREMAPRHLSDVQRNAIRVALTGHAGTLRVIQIGDAEAKRFALEIVAAIKSSGWSVGTSDVGTISPPWYGITYTTGVLASSPQTPDGLALVKALVEAGLDVTVKPGGINGAGLVIGLKPVK